MAPFTLTTSVKLSSGYEMPYIGLGVYLNNDCIPACEAALKHGYRHIDTANMYGNEEQVGIAVRNSGVKREDIFITTKVASNFHTGYEDVKKIVDESLRKLGVTYIDLYLIHDPLAGKERRTEAYRALVDSQAEGKIRTVGVSNYSVRHLEEIKEAGLPTPAVNQIELQPFCQQKDIADYCNARGIVVEAYCPLIRGDFSSPVLQRVAKEVNKNVPQVLVRWSLQSGFSPLPKSGDPKRVLSNVDIFDFELSPDQMAAINALDKGTPGAISWNPVDAP